MSVDALSRRQTVIHVQAIGGLGNRMFQHMAALYLLSAIPHSRLSGIELPEWGLHQPDSRDGSERSFTVHRDTPMRMPLEAIFEAVAKGASDCIDIRNYVQHMDNLLPPSMYRHVYVDAQPKTSAVGADELLINVRGQEILSGVAPDYVLIPVGYLRQIVAETGLRPVLMGQLTPSPYLDELLVGLPGARLISSQGVMEDFSIIRNAKHIVISISTFSWLAAWLSNAERIFFPVAGVFSPFQRPDINLLPLRDPRYRFDLFPSYFATTPDVAVEQHRQMEGLWRRLAGTHLEAMLSSRPRVPLDLIQIERFFDEDYYLRQHLDVGHAKQQGALPSGFEHFLRVGHKERREPFKVDREWYCRTYPMAALEIGQGDYVDCYHHYAEVGALRGYRPEPPDLANVTLSTETEANAPHAKKRTGKSRS